MTTYRLWPSTNGPSTPVSYTGNFISGLLFCVTAEAWFEGYWWWVCPLASGSGFQPAGATKCALWQNDPGGGAGVHLVPGSVVVSGALTAGQWNYIPLPTPIPLAQGGSSGFTVPTNNAGCAEYTAAIGCNGPFPDTNNYWGAGQVQPNGITNGPLTAYSNGSMPAPYPVGASGQAIFSTAGTDPAITYPGSTSSNDNFWVDVQVADYSAVSASNPPLRLWPNFPVPAPTVNGDNTKAVSGTAFTLSESCKLQKILMYNPANATGLPSRCGIWNTNTKAIVSGTDSGASPAWMMDTTKSIWDESVTISSHADSASYTLGNEFSLANTSLITAIRWYSPPGSAELPSAVAIWAVGSTSIVPGTQVNSPAWIAADGGSTPAAPGSGWMKCVLPAPVSLTGSTSYIVTALVTSPTNGYPLASASLPTTVGIFALSNYAFIVASSLTYPTTTGTSGLFGIDLEVHAPAAAGAGWIYVDYSAAGITLPAGNYATSFYDSAGVLFYHDTPGQFNPAGSGKGSSRGPAYNGISNGGGILTAPNVTSGPSLIYDDSSGTFPGQGSYQPGPASWVYPGEFEASSDWGESRWADVEVTPASSAAGVASLAGHGTLTAAALSLVPGHASQAGAGALSAHAWLRSPSSMAGHGTLAALGAVTRFSGFSSAGGGGSMSAVATVRAPQAAVPPPPRRNLPLWTRDVQPWAIAQERIRHDEALYQIGELTMFALMWHLEDFQATLVGRCQTCFVAEGTISDAYGQGNQYRCPDCFGTTFEGGFKAMIVRPAIFRDLDKNQTRQARGVTNMASTSIESTADFRVRTGDYCLRQTGDRFFLRVPRRTTLRTGFSSPWQAETAIDYVHANAVVQDPTSPAYIIFPDGSRLLRILQDPARLPVDITDFDPTEQGLP